ncbi:MAG: protein arginine kinase [Candidatus Eisenbacteria bacterium]|nr:protein arginine kinase [Candidatus Eisenbacteria bacterium]
MWTLATMMRESAGWLDASGPDSDVVLSTRIRIARNVDAVPFPDGASDDELVAVRERILSSMSVSNYLKSAVLLRMEDTDPITRRVMVERHMVSPCFESGGPGRAVVVGERELISAVINEEDHLRLQCIRSGLMPVDAWRLVERVDSELERNLHYAFDSDWGFLTACPTNVGTGLRVSVLAHLPGLSRTGGISRVLGSLSNLGLTVRGFYGEGSAAQGGFFQVSNQTTLGQSEGDITNTVERIAGQLSNLEREARAELLRADGSRLEDDVWRALGVLTNARMISAGEVMDLSSELRLGVALDLIDWPDMPTLNRLLVVTQPGHLELSGAAGSSVRQMDVARANLVRGILARVN